MALVFSVIRDSILFSSILNVFLETSQNTGLQEFHNIADDEATNVKGVVITSPSTSKAFKAKFSPKVPLATQITLFKPSFFCIFS